MTHKSLFKEVAQRIVQRGQLPDVPAKLQSQGDSMVSLLDSGQTRQMGDRSRAAERSHSQASSPAQR
ncbi:MAG: hypothetical protein WCK08_15725 [Betaproteobacteria bacterium]